MTNIYFIQAVSGGAVKIGKANDIKSRLAGIQCGNPYRLNVIIEICNVKPIVERLLHKHFEKERLVGEWFDEMILKDIEALAYTIECLTINNNYWHSRVIKNIKYHKAGVSEYLNMVKNWPPTVNKIMMPSFSEWYKGNEEKKEDAKVIYLNKVA